MSKEEDPVALALEDSRTGDVAVLADPSASASSAAVRMRDALSAVGPTSRIRVAVGARSVVVEKRLLVDLLVERARELGTPFAVERLTYAINEIAHQIGGLEVRWIAGRGRALDVRFSDGSEAQLFALGGRVRDANARRPLREQIEETCGWVERNLTDNPDVLAILDLADESGRRDRDLKHSVTQTRAALVQTQALVRGLRAELIRKEPIPRTTGLVATALGSSGGLAAGFAMGTVAALIVLGGGEAHAGPFLLGAASSYAAGLVPAPGRQRPATLREVHDLLAQVKIDVVVKTEALANSSEVLDADGQDGDGQPDRS